MDHQNLQWNKDRRRVVGHGVSAGFGWIHLIREGHVNDVLFRE